MALQNGAGDFVHTDQNKTFQIDELPLPALKHIFTFLSWRERKRLRQVCWGMQDFIDYEYGIHAYLPSRNLNPSHRLSMFTILKFIMGRLAGTLGHITDAKLGQAILSLEGKVIRSWEMSEMHPDFNPFPFAKIVRYPWRLRKICLKYVDVSFLLTVLSSCRNLSEFEYETGLHRQLPHGLMAWAKLGATFQPVPIPLENEKLIEYLTPLPPITFQVARLTSLSLTLQMVDTNFHSDWANVVFLLLSLSQRHLPNLQDFKFTLKPGRYIYIQNRLQLIACIGQLLSRCPRLKKLEYISRSNFIGVDNFEGDDLFDVNVGPRLLQNVFSSLANKYESELLQQLQVPGVLGFTDRMLVPIRQIMGEAARALTNLQDVIFTWSCAFETELFQILLSSLPSIRASFICGYTYLYHTGGAYNLLFPQIPPLRQPFHLNIERLCFFRCVGPNFSRTNNPRPISLSQMLDTMTSLKHLEIAPFIPKKQSERELKLEEHEPFYILEADLGEPNEIETPDISLDEVGDVRFQQLEVLKLIGVKFSTEAAARLIQLTNLKQLVLEVVPEYRHDLFGINSGDLLRLMGSSRKLEKISVNMILFPEDDALKSAQRTALEAIGSLKPMRRIDLGPNYRNWLNPSATIMKQLKFLLGPPHECIFH